jgi:hypothetical protein
VCVCVYECMCVSVYMFSCVKEKDDTPAIREQKWSICNIQRTINSRHETVIADGRLQTADVDIRW